MLEMSGFSSLSYLVKSVADAVRNYQDRRLDEEFAYLAVQGDGCFERAKRL